MSGQLSLGDVSIDMAEAQTQTLLIFAKKANQLVTHDEIVKRLWAHQDPSVNDRRNVTHSVYHLREVLAIGPLGGKVIQNIYGKGNVLIASEEACTLPEPRKIRPAQPSSTSSFINPFYGEAHDYCPNRDP